MQESVHREKSAISVCIVMMSIFLAGALWANDRHELNHMDDKELTEDIARFQKRLDRNPSDYEMLKAIGISYHIKSTRDVKKYAPKAVEFLSRAFEMNKDDYLTMCYLGSATTMMAKTTWNPIKKMSLVNKGTGLMDEAVKGAPDNFSVRITRGLNSRRLPSFLERGPIALEDFEYLAHLIQKHPEITVIKKKKVYINLAELYDEKGDQTKAKKFRSLAENL